MSENSDSDVSSGMESPDNNSDDELLNLGNEIAQGYLNESTKTQYARKIVVFKSWLRQYYPDVVDGNNNNINYQLMTEEMLTRFFTYVSMKINDDGSKTHYSFQHTNGYKSAIVDDWKHRENVIPINIVRVFTKFFKGLRRKLSSLKQNGELKMSEGKSPISFEGYRYLCKVSVKWNDNGGDSFTPVFSHLFLTLCWNLMARCNSVANIMFNHISWHADSLSIVFPKHKGI